MQISECYNILELQPNSSKDEIKKAYKKQALKFHPDKQDNNSTPEQKNIAEEQFKKVAEAYDILMNPEKQQNTSNFKREFVNPNELFNQIFRDMNISNNNPFSSRMNININNMNLNGGANCIMRSSSISIINGQRIEKITETINGVTRERIIVNNNNNNNNSGPQNIRINFN